MLDFIVSLLYPKKCVGCRARGSLICAQCFAKISYLDNQYCGICQKGSVDGMVHIKCKTPHSINGILSAVTYKGIVRKLLYQFKYSPHLTSLSPVLSRIMYEGLIQNESFMRLFEAEKNLWITCVPITQKRERSRGYNQSELLAKDLARMFEAPFVSGLLARVKETQPQFELTKEQRRENMKNAFKLNPKFRSLIKGKSVVVVDDITTTGSTLKECGKVLKSAGASKVVGVTLAHEA